MRNASFQQRLQKCREVLAKGHKSDWGYEWFIAFEPVFRCFIRSLHSNSVKNVPEVGKMIKLSATFLLQAAPKIMPYMPKSNRKLRSYRLLSQLHDLAWWHDELAEMAMIFNGEKAKAGAVEPMIRREGSTKTSTLTARSTRTRKRPAVDDPIEENPTKKVARPSGRSGTRSLAQANLASTSSSLQPHADDPRKTRALDTSLASEHADDAVFDALDDIRALLAEATKRLNKLETMIHRS